jgi:signal transduction histidine kinase/CheY-like chemotaxis protein/HPt (histidine-containing phosphotransfer) domain-containing protein
MSSLLSLCCVHPSDDDAGPRNAARYWVHQLAGVDVGQIELRDDALTRAHDELEERVAQRTAELEVARDAAQDASRAKSEFLANMSHEIRTPLNAVMGLTDVLLSTRLDERQTDFLVTVRDSADALLSVLNDILDFSKIEAGKLDLERVHFSIHDTVEDTLTALALRADAKGLELACYVDPDLPTPLVGDPGRLRQVISNLVSNAVKFTEEGEVVVRVTADEPLGGSVRLRFSVRDTGIGIPADKLDRLFDPFEQADTSTTRRYGGTGLGLSISRQLVEMMSGEIGAESTPGVGSTFHFTSSFAVPERARMRTSEGGTALEGIRVLIVDDNETNCTILSEVTTAKSMRPVVARSADEAFARLEQGLDEVEPFELLVSDVHMPVVDGFMLAERLRRDGRFSTLPIVFLTSAGQTGDLERCEALGVSSRLVKPVKQSELYQVMTRALGPAHGPPEREIVHAPAWADAESPPLAPLRILLVEDSPANRKVALAMLGGMGHSFEVATNGREALDLLAQQRFDVVLMDVQMPEMDGLEATAAIRAGETGTVTHVPIIAMTAHALQGDREKCLAAGMDDYVSKPIRRAQLLEALRRAVSADVAAPAAPRAPHSEVASAPPARSGAGEAIRGAPLFQELSGEVDVLHEVVDAYVTETFENLRRLPGLIAHGAFEDVRRLAHTLKGAMRGLGAENAAREAFALEELARACDLTAASAVLERVDVAVGAALPAWIDFLESGVIPD